MILRLWKNRQITPWSMLPLNRLEQAVTAVLLLSISAPWGHAEEVAGGKVRLRDRSQIRRVSLEECEAVSQPVPKQTANERWNGLKSKYQPSSTDSEFVNVTNSRRSANSDIRPFPEVVNDDIAVADEWAQTQTPADDTTERSDDAGLNADEPDELVLDENRPDAKHPQQIATEPLPISDFEAEPSWVSASAADLNDLIDAEAEQGKDAAESESLGNAVEKSEPETAVPAASPTGTESKNVPMPKTNEPGYTRQSGARRPPKMNEISPHYDVTIDQDIREFAKEQARQYNVEFSKGPFPQRSFPGLVYQWEPSNLYHLPLYFEDPQLERYGHTYGPIAQPFVSIARFSTQLAFLPYQMTIDPVCTPKYALGWYRPGDCAPKLHYQPPLNATAAAVEAGVVTGLFFAIP